MSDPGAGHDETPQPDPADGADLDSESGAARLWTAGDSPPGQLRVVVPDDPPAFDPDAARALLDLLIHLAATSAAGSTSMGQG